VEKRIKLLYIIYQFPIITIIKRNFKMLTSKSIKTVENYHYNGTGGVKLDPTLLLRLLEFAYEDANSDVQLHVITSKATAMSAEKGLLGMEDYSELINFDSPIIMPAPEPIIQPEEPMAGTEAKPPQ